MERETGLLLPEGLHGQLSLKSQLSLQSEMKQKHLKCNQSVSSSYEPDARSTGLGSERPWKEGLGRGFGGHLASLATGKCAPDGQTRRSI